jgi:hypothetical protein
VVAEVEDYQIFVEGRILPFPAGKTCHPHKLHASSTVLHVVFEQPSTTVDDILQRLDHKLCPAYYATLLFVGLCAMFTEPDCHDDVVYTCRRSA